jgi:hypothetical protein
MAKPMHIMEEQKGMKRAGRPALAVDRKRQKVTLRLNQGEIQQLRKEYEGHTVGFSVFCREKLLNREAVTLSKPLDEGVRRQLTHLLKFSGSLLLLAQKTRDSQPVSEDFRTMASQLREIVQRAHYSVQEITLSQSLVMQVTRALERMEAVLSELRQQWPGEEGLQFLAESLGNLQRDIRIFHETYNLNPGGDDR